MGGEPGSSGLPFFGRERAVTLNKKKIRRKSSPGRAERKAGGRSFPAQEASSTIERRKEREREWKKGGSPEGEKNGA